MMGHTALPWEYMPSDGHHGPYISSLSGDICDFYTMSDPDASSALGGASSPIHFQGDSADDNAAFIVLACNTRNDLLAACKAAEKALAALIETLYGQGLEVANWHKNGDLEAMDNFFDENTTGDELPKLREAIARATPTEAT